MLPVASTSVPYGTTNIADINSNTDFRDSQQSYGMWFVPPDVGNRVLVMFVEGNANKAYWIGCIPKHLMNMQVLGPACLTMTDTEDPRIDWKKITRR